MLNQIIKRGQIYQVDLGRQEGSIQAGTRPVVVVSNNLNNKFSPTVNVLPITSKTKNSIPVHVEIGITEGLPQLSTVLVEQMVTINKNQLTQCLGQCSMNKMHEIERAILIQNGIDLQAHHAI